MSIGSNDNRVSPRPSGLQLGGIMDVTRWAAVAAVAASQLLATTVGAEPRACATPRSALGVERIIEIDATSGAHFGDVSRQAREPSFLAPKEVVLTFDDGPLPRVTNPILDTLDRFCTKATFFSVGRMALAFPETAKEVIRRGHTLAAHTWSHPLNLRRLTPAAAEQEIEKGFAALVLASGQPVAPFFRFPGLNDSPALLTYLQSQGIATFTVDVISNDSYIGSAERLAETTLRRIEARQGGIVLFHDIKAVTARALPTILAGLKSRGYKIVHLTPKNGYSATRAYDAELGPILARRQIAMRTPPVEVAPVALPPAPVTVLAPPPRNYQIAAAAALAESPEEVPPPRARSPRSRRVAAVRSQPGSAARRASQASMPSAAAIAVANEP